MSKPPPPRMRPPPRGASGRPPPSRTLPPKIQSTIPMSLPTAHTLSPADHTAASDDPFKKFQTMSKRSKPKFNSASLMRANPKSKPPKPKPGTPSATSAAATRFHKANPAPLSQSNTSTIPSPSSHPPPPPGLGLGLPPASLGAMSKRVQTPKILPSQRATGLAAPAAPSDYRRRSSTPELRSLPRSRDRNELTVSDDEMKMLSRTASAHDTDSPKRGFWATLKAGSARNLLKSDDETGDSGSGIGGNSGKGARVRTTTSGNIFSRFKSHDTDDSGLPDAMPDITITKSGTKRSNPFKKFRGIFSSSGKVTSAAKNDPRPVFAKGSCHCGKIVYELLERPQDIQHCYCSMCRKCHGAAMATWIPAKEADIKWVSRGGLNSYKSSEHGTRFFCGNCGSNISLKYGFQLDTLWITAALFDERSIAQPDWYESCRVLHIFCTSRCQWYELPTDSYPHLSDNDIIDLDMNAFNFDQMELPKKPTKKMTT